MARLFFLPRYLDDGTRANSAKSILFYITPNDSVSSSTFRILGWDGVGFDLGIHPTAPMSRHLSVTSVSDTIITTNNTEDVLLLFYENPGGNVTALLTTALLSVSDHGSTTCPSFIVSDISSSKSLALPPYIPKDYCPPGYHIEPGLKAAHDTGATSYAYGPQRGLYDTEPEATFSVPFTSHQNWANSTQLHAEVLFYGPSTNIVLVAKYFPQSGFETGVHQLSIVIIVKRLMLSVRYQRNFRVQEFPLILT